MKRLAYHHHPCADGFGAALAMWLAYPDTEFRPFTHPFKPDVTTEELDEYDSVTFLDCCPPVEWVAPLGEKVFVVDHHSGNQPFVWELRQAGARVLFDLERSGARLAWDAFQPRKPTPSLIDVIEDRDLWRFAFPTTRAAMASIFSYPYDFEVWRKLLSMPALAFAADGEGILRKQEKDVRELCGDIAHELLIYDRKVIAANVPYTLSSEVGHRLLETNPGQYAFAVSYTIVGREARLSLRSTDDRLDVSEFARQHGGNGHRNAAGCTVPFALFQTWLV